MEKTHNMEVWAQTNKHTYTDAENTYSDCTSNDDLRGSSTASNKVYLLGSE